MPEGNRRDENVSKLTERTEGKSVKGARGLAKVIVGLGWDEAKPSGGGGLFGALFGSSSHQAIDCDASAIMLKNGKFTDKTDLVYFGNLKHKSGTVNHMGDNLTGAGEEMMSRLLLICQEFRLNMIRLSLLSISIRQ